MEWLVYLEMAIVAVLAAYNIYRIVVSIRENKLLPVVLEAIERAEIQDGLSGEDKLNFAIDYIKREATTKHISVDIAKTVKLIETLVSLTKKVNVK